MAFIPLHDGTPLRFIARPYVNWLLIAVTVAAYFLVEHGDPSGTANANLVSFGLIPATLNGLVERPPELALIPDAATLVTYAFLHGSLWHLAGNMLFLWVFGDNVEDSLGHLRYLLFYCLTAAGGGLAFMLSVPESQSPLIGASGAVAGVVAAYLLLHPRARIWVLVFIGIPLRINALWLLGFWLLVQIYALVAGGETEVAYWSHIGGFLCGAILVTILKRPGVRLFDRGGNAG
jgi:membrane associated rhomboid family serine protease